jgi:hypothetical protein
MARVLVPVILRVNLEVDLLGFSLHLFSLLLFLGWLSGNFWQIVNDGDTVNITLDSAAIDLERGFIEHSLAPFLALLCLQSCGLRHIFQSFEGNNVA